MSWSLLRPLSHLASVVAAAIILAGCASASLSPDGLGQRPAAEVSAEDRARLYGRVFDRAVALVETRYYDPRIGGIDWRSAAAQSRPLAVSAADDNVLYGVLTSLLDQLDDAHVYVQSPAEVSREAAEPQARPLFGLRVLRRGNGWIVDDVRPGSPADTAGVQVGWRVESADGRPYDVGVLRAEGRPVRLAFRDGAGAARALIVAPRSGLQPQERRPLVQRNGVWVIAFDSFDEGTAEWLFGQVEAARPGAPLVVDLRDNVGGRIVEVERALGCFLPRRTVVARMQSRRGRQRVSEVIGGCPRPVSGPVAVLIGRRSRSGAEMFAAALQEQGRAVTVGSRTAGALLSSLRYDLPDGGRLTLSEADFVTAGGRRIERVGVVPDVEAVATQADRRAGRDPALDVAAAALTRQAADVGVRSPAPEGSP